MSSRPRAITGPDAADPPLRGRSYSVPFALVWQEALALALSLPRWELASADPRAGIIDATVRTRVWKFIDDVRIRISLGEDGDTRVDLVSASRVGRTDFGVNARRIARFLHQLDARLAAQGGESFRSRP